MEKDSGFPNCHLSWPPPAAELAAMAYPLPDQLQQCFLAQFDSAPTQPGQFEGFGNPSLQPQKWSSQLAAGCFAPQGLNSPPKLNLSMVGSQSLPGGEGVFADRPARMPCFLPNYGGKFPLSETGRLSRVPSQLSGALECKNEIPIPSRSSGAEDGELSASEHTPTNGANSRKRKSTKVAEEVSEANAKRSRAAEISGNGKDDVKPKIEAGGASEEQKPKRDLEKAPEAPKQDYIHVRARRGQATDAHSLAERVRREKISERMKFLQNLVPGCNKVTGKAVMLDEIINYVQSLQRQVEFLSMKLATVNPKLEIDVDTILQKDMHQSRGSLSQPVYPMEAPVPPTFPFSHPPPQGDPLQNIATNGMESPHSNNPLNLILSRRPLGVQPPMLQGFPDIGSQVGIFWGDDLHKVVQMGSGQNQEDMKIKL